MADSALVIKVKYGDVLRRFNAQIVDEELVDFNMGRLRLKILTLFNFTTDTSLTLTYSDEDGDEVTLVDEDDLREVVRQGLNPLRITVKLNTEKNARPYASSSGNSSPSRSSQVHQPFENPKPNVSELLKSVPEPIHDSVRNFLTELKSKVPSSAPVIPELVDHFAKMGLSYLDQLSNSRPEEQSNAQIEVSESTKNQESSKVDPSTSKEPPSERREGSGKHVPEKGREVKLGNIGTGKVDPPERAFPPPSQKLLSSLPRRTSKFTAPVSYPPHMPRFVFRDGRWIPVPEIPFPASPVGDASAIPPYSASQIRPINLNDVKGGSLDASSSKAPWDVNAGIPHVTTYVSGDGVWMAPRPVNEISSAFTPYSASQMRTFYQNDGSANFFHRGVHCDGCGANPITGPRFKSKVEADYDLCSVCFENFGNDCDYIRIDRSVVYQHPPSVNELRGPMAAMRRAAMGRAEATLSRHGSGGPVVPKFDSCFVRDVNIIDGTVMAPSTPFTKIWLMRNNGTCVWPQKTQLVWVGGDKLNNTLAIDIKVPPSGLPVGVAVNVAVDFVAPETAGRYISSWRMASPSGRKFGQRVWVRIEVDASVKAQHESIHDFNLNLSPPSGSLSGPEIINMEQAPRVEGTHLHHSQPSNSTMEVGGPMVDVNKPNNEQHEKKFPINDSLLVGAGGGSHSAPSAPPSLVSYPEIDFTEVAPVFPLQPLSIPSQASSSQLVPQENEVEEKLLTELEAMGFKQVHLNKEILRKNGYNLQQSADDLCNVYEWDPMLEELREMGFNNTELNKKLLEENDGNLSEVVMHLISGDQK